MKLKNILIFSFFLATYFSCKKNIQKKELSGDFYTNQSYPESSICPLFFSFQKDSLYVQYNDRADKWRFKLDYIKKDSIRLSYKDEGETFLKYIKDNGMLILIDTVNSFKINKDTIVLYPLSKDFMRINQFSYSALKGYWHTTEFYPNLNKKQEVWLKLGKDSIFSYSNIDSKLEYQKNKYEITSYNNFSVISILNVPPLSRDAVFSVDYFDNLKLRLVNKNCNNYKYSIHLKRIDSIQYFNRKLNEENYSTLEDLLFEND